MTRQGNPITLADHLGYTLMIGMRMRKCQHGQFAVTDLPQDATSGPACGGVDKHVADQVNIDDVRRKTDQLPDIGANLSHHPSSQVEPTRHSRLRRPGADLRGIFQPCDMNIPPLAAVPDEVERLRHLPAGVSSTIAVLLSEGDLWDRTQDQSQF